MQKTNNLCALPVHFSCLLWQKWDSFRTSSHSVTVDNTITNTSSILGDRCVFICATHKDRAKKPGEMISIASLPVRPPTGAYEIRNCCFQSPPPRGVLGLISIGPLLWWLTRLQFWPWSLTVKVDKTYRCCHQFYSRWHNFYSQWWNLQVLSCVSFITDCKKFRHQL